MVSGFPGCSLFQGQCCEGLGNKSAGRWAQAVVVKDQVLERSMLGKKGLKRRNCIEAESIVGEVDRVEIG